MVGGIANPVPNGFHRSKKTDLLRHPDFVQTEDILPVLLDHVVKNRSYIGVLLGKPA